jgi:hypothetical protein
LRRPETSWLVLGVCKKPKEYGPIKKTINQEQFLGIDAVIKEISI